MFIAIFAIWFPSSFFSWYFLYLYSPLIFKKYVSLYQAVGNVCREKRLRDIVLSSNFLIGGF